MSPPSLSPERIVHGARELIEAEGLPRLSMRRLGAHLGVDPMALYRHVPNKQAILALVVAQCLAELPTVSEATPWHEQVRDWARAYWLVVHGNQAVFAAALADPQIAQDAHLSLRPLELALISAGMPEQLVEANTYLVVDFVHGSALGSLADAPEATSALQKWFEVGLATILAGMASLVE